jgi:hypothetical protein
MITNSLSMIDALNARSLGERTPNKFKLLSTEPAAAHARRMITFFLISP